MKNAAKNVTAALAGIVLASYSLMPFTIAHADTRPYFKEFGNDVSVGGWFNNGNTSCGNSQFFQDDKYKPDGVSTDAQKSYGGIYTYMRSDASGNFYGASSQYNVFATGAVDGDNNFNGFYSGNILGNKNTLSFANFGLSGTPAGFSSGLWGGSLRDASNCIPDYYGTKDKTPTDAWPGQLSGTLTGTHVYDVDATASPVSLVNGTTTVGKGAWITVFVKGNVIIDRNINYEQGYDATNIPRFSLVVLGNIYVTPVVTNLDGLYIAQPDMSSPSPATDTTGTFWSCDDGNKSSFTVNNGVSWIAANCNNNEKLTVNGAVIAKQFYLFRVFGDVSSASINEGPNGSHIAEVFNFTPAMVIAGPMLPGTNDTNINKGDQPVFDSVLSLPPTF